MVKKPTRRDDTTDVLDAPEVLAAPVLKWASWPGNNGMITPATTSQVGNITGTGTGGQAPGAIAVGDLLIVAAHAGKNGGINDYTISGSGWTQILNPSAADDEIKIFVWWKNATSADVTAAGVYTVTWGGMLPEAWSWAEWNFGQNAFVDAWNGIWSNLFTSTNGLNPACFPTGNADTLLTYWFNYHCNTAWTLPGGLTTVFNNTQGGLPSQGASATKTLAAAGFTGNLVATPGINQQYGAFQIAISTGAPPNGGGGMSPIKWLSFMATQPTVAMGTSVIVNSQAIAQSPGPFATGDLFVVAVSVEADSGPSGVLSISGTGWTNMVATAVGPLNTRLSVWAKTVGAGETGIYTVSWPNATGNPNWVTWNLGQATIDVAAGQSLVETGNNLVAPSITTTQANEAVLAYWFAVDTGGPGLGIMPPATAGFTTRAINLVGQFKWDLTFGDFLAPTAGATGNLTATSVTANLPAYTAFQLAFKPTPSGGGAPPVPTGLTATAFSSTQINLSWTASSGATSYNVLRGGTPVGTPSGTTFSDTGLTPSTGYTYTVQAVSAGGTSASSSPASATTLASGGTAPPTPTGLTATPISQSQINLTWSASSGATSYNVLRGGTTVGTPSGTNFSDTGLTPSTSYTYTVQAVSSGGTSASSSPASATTFAAGTSLFPLFTPIYPPPPVGADKTVPNFPPPTPPPIGTVPVGDLVGPAVAPAPVPPSVAGNPLVRFGFGSATTPPASAAFPEQTTTYPSPPVVFSNIYTGGSPPVTPPATTSTPPLGLSYNTGGALGPPIGPALPPVVPGGTRPFMVDDADTAAAPPPPEEATNNDDAVYDDDDDDENDEEDWFDDPKPPTPSASRTTKPKRGRSSKK